MIKLIKILGLLFIVPSVVIILLMMLKVSTVITEMFISLWMGLLYFLTLIKLFNFHNSRKGKFKGSLYEWMEELSDTDEKLTFQLKRMTTRYKTIENLTAIKEIILKSTNSELKELKLFKAYYTLSLKESTEELYYKIIIGLISSAGVFVIRDQLSKIEGNNPSDLFFIGLMIIFTILAFVGIINENKKSSGLMIELLEICINEIEENNKKKEKYY